VGEDEALNLIKKQLSKKEKIEESIHAAEALFTYESQVSHALSMLEVESSFFDDTMNELRSVFESSLEKLEELEDISVEEVLDRIEQLSELKRRYGGIAEALDYREQKAKELESYEMIEHSRGDLTHKIGKLMDELQQLADELSQLRAKEIDISLDKLNGYLNMLYLRPASLNIEKVDHHLYGVDRVILGLEGTKLEKLSSGEFNRLRLALLHFVLRVWKNKAAY